MDRSLTVAISSASTCTVTGTFMRHVSPKVEQLASSSAGGRWGPPGAFGVLYLGRPEDSVVVEAYRHLIDDDLDGQMTAAAVGPRRLITCEVNVDRVLDLRDADADAVAKVGLDHDALRSAVGTYGPCHRVARAAHQLELHGIIAPAATGLGETLALFETHVPADQWPVLTATEMWSQLPADPRRLRLADDATGS